MGKLISWKKEISIDTCSFHSQYSDRVPYYFFQTLVFVFIVSIEIVKFERYIPIPSVGKERVLPNLSFVGCIISFFYYIGSHTWIIFEKPVSWYYVLSQCRE